MVVALMARLSPGTQIVLFALMFFAIVVGGGTIAAWFIGWK